MVLKTTGSVIVLIALLLLAALANAQTTVPFNPM